MVEVQNGSGTSDPYIYQWMQVGVGPAPGNDSTDTYTPSTANIGTEYYYCIVTQQASGCQDISDTAEVIVTSAPEITLDPVGDTACIDGSIINDLTVDYINGAGLPTYQWFFVDNTGDTIPIGTNSNTLDAALISTATVGTFPYWCTINFNSGDCDEVTSDTAYIVVNPDPTITTEPIVTDTICVGGVIDSLTVAYGNGVGTPTYEWFKNGVAIPNTDNPSYLPPASDFLAAGNIYYHAQVYLSGNGCDTAISDSANIVIVNDPIVTLIDTITPVSYTHLRAHET